jgi:DoxX-like protein
MTMIWAGRIMSGLVALFLLFDSVIKLVKLPIAVEATMQLGYPEHTVVGIGVVLLVCLIVYLIRRTAIFGAILLTGYLGGAIAAQVRVGSPLFSHVLFPIYVALLVWGGVFLRCSRLRALIPVQRSEP